MNNNNHIVIQGWMVNELDLKGNELITYALIYGFSQDGESKFKGSCSYVAEWLNTTRQTAINTLKSLTNKQLLLKKEIEKNGLKFCEYVVNFEVLKSLQGVKNFDRGCKKFLHNNINNNISKDILLLDNIVNGDKPKTSAKQKYLDRCEKVINEFDFSEDVYNIIYQFLEENKKLTETQLRGQLQILSKDYLTEKEQLETVNNSILYGYKGLCYPKNNTRYKKPIDDTGLTDIQRKEIFNDEKSKRKEIAEAGGIKQWAEKNNIQKF